MTDEEWDNILDFNGAPSTEELINPEVLQTLVTLPAPEVKQESQTEDL